MTMLYQMPTNIPNAPSTTVVNYTGLDSVIAWNSNQILVGNKVGGAASGLTIGTYVVTTTNGPGATGSYVLDVVTIALDGTVTATGLTCSLPANSTGPYTFTGGPNTIAQGGNRVAIRSTPTGTPGTLGVMSWNQKRTSTDQVLMSGQTNATSITAGATRYVAVHGGGSSSTFRNECRPCPHALTVANLFLETSQDIGNGKTVAVTLLEVIPAGGFYDGTIVRTLLTATITGNGSNSVTASDITHSVSAAQGTLLVWEVVAAAGITAGTKLFIGCGLTPGIAGDCAIFYEAFPLANATAYTWPQSNTASATEGPVQAYMFAADVKNLNAILSGGTATFVDYANNEVGTLTVHKNGSGSGAPTLSYTGVGGASGAVQKSDLLTILAYSEGDLISLINAMSGGGTNPSNSWGLTVNMSQNALMIPPLERSNIPTRGVLRGVAA